MDGNGKSTEIRIGGEWMVKRTDSLNWRAFRLREVCHDDGTRSMEWIADGGYYGTPEGAARHVAEETAGSLGDVTAKGFCKAFREACETLAEAVAKAA